MLSVFMFTTHIIQIMTRCIVQLEQMPLVGSSKHTVGLALISNVFVWRQRWMVGNAFIEKYIYQGQMYLCGDGGGWWVRPL